MIDRKLLAIAIAILASTCLAAACTGGNSLVAPSSTSISSPLETRSTISGRVTSRETEDGIGGARITVQAGSMKGASAVSDASGFYSVAVKTGHVQVSVKAENYIDRSEVLDVSDSTMRVDFQLMPAIDD